MSDSWQLYICRACGLIYDEEQGDPDSGLAPGTRFEDIPEDWECPLCGVKKSDFELFARPNIAAQAKQGANLRHTTTEPGIVIIGAGIAGWSVAQQMRAINGETPITMITACNGDRYHKPELSVAMGRQLSTEKLVSASGLESASQLNVNLWPNTYVIGVSPALKQIRTTRGTLHYTKLVIAQGAKPFLSEALPASLCYRVNHLKDWHSLSEKLAGSTKHIAIIGSGMIGCELAEDFARSGHSIALVSRDAHPLNEILPEAASLQLEQSLSKEGVQFLADRDVQHINRNDDGTISLSFAHHDDLVVDVVVSAIGLSTDERIARLAALEFDHGIVVDPETLQTSDPDVYALGDCASIGGNIYRFVEPIIAQSKIIAQQISGLSDQRYSLTPPVIRLKTRSCPVVIHGFPVRNGRWQTLKDDDEEMIMEQRSDDELIATLSVPKKIA